MPEAGDSGGDAKPAGPRSRKGLQTRARIVDAAKGVFEDQGFLEARISDIAERAGLSHGSFYHYFESKEDVFLEVLAAQEHRFRHLSIVDVGFVDETGADDIHGRLRTSLRRYLEKYRTEARIIGVIEQVARSDEGVRKVRLARRQQYLEQVEVAIRAVQEQGLADGSVDAAIGAGAITSMVTHFAEMWFVERTLSGDFDHVVDQLTTLCINALGLAPGPRG